MPRRKNISEMPISEKKLITNNALEVIEESDEKMKEIKESLIMLGYSKIITAIDKIIMWNNRLKSELLYNACYRENIDQSEIRSLNKSSDKKITKESNKMIRSVANDIISKISGDLRFQNQYIILYENDLGKYVSMISDKSMSDYALISCVEVINKPVDVFIAFIRSFVEDNDVATFNLLINISAEVDIFISSNVDEVYKTQFTSKTSKSLFRQSHIN